MASSDRDAVISAANVLMVALLKMNRVLVPVVLKYNRARRLRWIQSAEHDLLRDDARLCARCRPLRPIWAVLLPWADPDAHAAHAASPMPEPKAGAGVGWGEDGDERGALLGGLDGAEVEMEVQNVQETNRRAATFASRVKMEVMRRRAFVSPFVYTSVVSTTFTIATIWLYSLSIIVTVLSLFPFGRAQGLVFSFSLVATATISEAEVLLRKTPPRVAAGGGPEGMDGFSDND